MLNCSIIQKAARLEGKSVRVFKARPASVRPGWKDCRQSRRHYNCLPKGCLNLRRELSPFNNGLGGQARLWGLAQRDSQFLAHCDVMSFVLSAKVEVAELRGQSSKGRPGRAQVRDKFPGSDSGTVSFCVKRGRIRKAMRNDLRTDHRDCCGKLSVRYQYLEF